MASLDRDLTLLIRERVCKTLCCPKIYRCRRLCTKSKKEVGIAINTYIVARPESGFARIIKDFN